VLCLHDGLTPYRRYDADVDLDRLLEKSRVSFDCVLISDEHRPKNKDLRMGIRSRRMTERRCST